MVNSRVILLDICLARWKRLQEEGVAGLYRRRRSDRGRPRKAQADLLARGVELKKEQPFRSDRVINRILRREFGREVPRSTLYAHLHRAGATRQKLGVSKKKVRCRWTREQTNALWVGDFEHGPLVMHHGQAVKTYLSAWIDCHSRYIVEARYYVRENMDVLIDSLLRAWGQQCPRKRCFGSGWRKDCSTSPVPGTGQPIAPYRPPFELQGGCWIPQEGSRMQLE